MTQIHEGNSSDQDTADATEPELQTRTPDAGAFRTIVQAYGPRLYRIARGIVRNDSEAEDVLQEAYLRAFMHLGAFRGQSSLATWLSRIVINESLGRLRKRKRRARTIVPIDHADAVRLIRLRPVRGHDDPEMTMAQRQILCLVEGMADRLPDIYRTVLVARTIEELNIEETAELLGIRPETVKTRLYRARSLLRHGLDARIGPVPLDAFPFTNGRCEPATTPRSA